MVDLSSSQTVKLPEGTHKSALLTGIQAEVTAPKPWIGFVDVVGRFPFPS